MRSISIICLGVATGMAVGYLTRWLVSDYKLYHFAAVLAFGWFCYIQGALIEATNNKKGDKNVLKESAMDTQD